MKLNILTIQEQCLAISSSTRAMQDLYGDLEEIVATRRISLTYVVEVLNEHIREANRILEEELEPLIRDASVTIRPLRSRSIQMEEINWCDAIIVKAKTTALRKSGALETIKAG